MAFIRKRAPRFPVVAKELRTMDGHIFASKREMKRYADLKMLERAGEIRDLELQPKFPVEIGGKHFCTYTSDFRYWNVRLGEYVIEDCKSSGTAKDASYRLRKKAAQLAHGITVTEVGV